MRFGLDLGGTKIEAVILDAADEIIWRERQVTPAHDYQSILHVITRMVETAEQQVESPLSIGIGMPGSISPKTGLVRNSNTLCLNGQALREDLTARLGREVRLANDANCFALSEAKDGAGAGADSVFGVILGTGCGGGLVLNQHLQIGANAIAGEWGHNPLAAPRADEVPGPDCYCGRKGCNEVWISGSGFARDHLAITGQDLTSEAIMAAGTAEASASFERLCDRLARALGGVINLLDPAVIVLGGGLSNIEAIYERVPEIWQAYIFSDIIDTRLVRNQHGDASGVRGAAWLWPHS
jgi:fructokinase